MMLCFIHALTLWLDYVQISDVPSAVQMGLRRCSWEVQNLVAVMHKAPLWAVLLENKVCMV